MVHNAQKTFLWARQITDTLDEGVQALCVSCHSAEGIAAKKTLSGYSHPLNIVPAEKGVSTTLPLFDQNGQPTEAGLMTCQTCHDPHRWDPLSYKSAKDRFNIEGNAQNSFLRIANSPSAKLCENCHPQQASVEKTDHDLLVSAPYSKNGLDEIPAESGVCGTCHLVHNSQTPVKLWARRLSGGGAIIDQMCTSCHSKAGPANKKVPLIASHPDNVVIITRKSTGVEDKFLPLFDKTTAKSTRVGNLSCASCHNVHQWEFGSKSKGTGIESPEGSVLDNFLRTSSLHLMCKDCHGPDALFRYLYFHDPTQRTGRQG